MDGLLTATPPPVIRARELAARLGCANSCTDAVGQLLRRLAARVRTGQIGELGTGAGAGASWLASSIHGGVTLVSIERDAGRVAAAKTLLSALSNGTLPHGDWRDLPRCGPFTLLFVDVGEAKWPEAGLVVNVLADGGMAVLDDLTPEALWPVEWRGRSDPVRDFWLNDARLSATEFLVTPSEAVIVATRVTARR